jgi:hypothetical protein
MQAIVTLRSTTGEIISRIARSMARGTYLQTKPCSKVQYIETVVAIVQNPLSSIIKHSPNYNYLIYTFLQTTGQSHLRKAISANI